MAVVIEQIEANPPARPDDAAGQGFARQLATMKRRVAKRNEPPITRPDYEWILEDIEPWASAEWQMSASPPGYYLLALKMTEDFLAQQPLTSPRINWSVYRMKNDCRRDLADRGQHQSGVVTDAPIRLDSGCSAISRRGSSQPTFSGTVRLSLASRRPAGSLR